MNNNFDGWQDNMASSIAPTEDYVGEVAELLERQIVGWRTMVGYAGEFRVKRRIPGRKARPLG
jgi:hypothetical protein